MIRNDDELILAQKAIENLQRILIQARKTHTHEEYRALSEPILIELQQRQDDVLAYLAQTQEVAPS